jgi:DNA-binding NarL/FixJ family response regulator
MRKEIAFELNVTIGTVKTYMNRIFTKCNVTSKNELLKIFNIKKSN